MISDDSLRKQAAGCALMEQVRFSTKNEGWSIVDKLSSFSCIQFIVSTERRHEFYESLCTLFVLPRVGKCANGRLLKGIFETICHSAGCLLSPSHSRAALHALRLMIRSSRANLRVNVSQSLILFLSIFYRGRLKCWNAI